MFLEEKHKLSWYFSILGFLCPHTVGYYIAKGLLQLGIRLLFFLASSSTFWHLKIYLREKGPSPHTRNVSGKEQAALVAAKPWTLLISNRSPLKVDLPLIRHNL